MAYAKKMLILNQVNDGFSTNTEPVKGLVTLEDCGDGEVKIRLDLFNLRDVRRGFVGAVLKSDGHQPTAVRLNGHGTVRHSSAIKAEEFRLDGRLFCVVGFVSDDKVVPILWGANNALKLDDTRIMDGFAKLVNPEVFVGAVEPVRKLGKSTVSVDAGDSAVQATGASTKLSGGNSSSEAAKAETGQERPFRPTVVNDNITSPRGQWVRGGRATNARGNYGDKSVIIKHGFDKPEEDVVLPGNKQGGEETLKSAAKPQAEVKSVDKQITDKGTRTLADIGQKPHAVTGSTGATITVPTRVRAGAPVAPSRTLASQATASATPPPLTKSNYNDGAVLGYNPYPADIGERVAERASELGRKWSEPAKANKADTSVDKNLRQSVSGAEPVRERTNSSAEARGTVAGKKPTKDNQSADAGVNDGERFVKSWDSAVRASAGTAPLSDKQAASHEPEKENAASASANQDNRRYANYYLNIKPDLDELFARSEPLQVLNRNLPDSKWIKVAAEGEGGQFYAVGLIGDNPDYIGYGVPGRYSVNPPKELEEYCQWLPLDSSNPKGEGFWMMYQDAETGATVRLDI